MTGTMNAEATYTTQHAKAMTHIMNSELTIKIFLFSGILLCINLVAFL